MPVTDGWYVMNLAEALSFTSPRGSYLPLEGAGVRFPQFGIIVHVLQPGESTMYHRESEQEAFLILDGQCTAIIEGVERTLNAWDFFHCPAGTGHAFVGAGIGPCAILMVGARDGGTKIDYPADPVAQKHGAGVRVATSRSEEAYAGLQPPQPGPIGWVPPSLR
jgi:uncharacterized cupin superfamily protein